MADQDFILAPVSIQVDFDVDPVKNILDMMMMLSMADFYSGFSSWITETAMAMSPERKRAQDVVFDGLHAAVVPNERINGSFLEYVDEIAAEDPVSLRDRAMKWMMEKENWPGIETALGDVDAFSDFMEEVIECKQDKDYEFKPEIWREVYRLLNDPPAMRDYIVSHLRTMWEEVVAAEWELVEPMLQESVDAFQQVDFTALSVHETLQFVTGRDLRGVKKVDEKCGKATRIVFTPSAHIGPYISHFDLGDARDVLQIFFGARLPQGAQVRSTALSRSELLVRLNALADDTRLRMLELLTQHNELCAQDFITVLGLSQSSASRHLRQLTATGYVTERRREVAKCYSLNGDRLDDTLQALKLFLRRK